MIKLTYDQWVEKFRPVMEEGNYRPKDMWIDAKSMQRLMNTDFNNTIWTLVEDNDEMFIIQGLAVVNRLEVFECEVAFKQAEVYKPIKF